MFSTLLPTSLQCSGLVKTHFSRKTRDPFTHDPMTFGYATMTKSKETGGHHGFCNMVTGNERRLWHHQTN